MPEICSVDTSPLLYFYRIDQLILLQRWRQGEQQHGYNAQARNRNSHS